MEKEAKLRTLLPLALSLVTLLAVTVGLFLFLRDNALQTTERELETVGKSVRECLKFHGEPGETPRLESCIRPLREEGRLLDIWIARSRSLIEEYGSSGFLAREADDLDKKTMRTGKIQFAKEPETLPEKVRVSLPFKATSVEEPRCMRCHKALEGDVLGVLSFEYDMAESSGRILSATLKIAAALGAALFAIWWLAARLVAPYRRLVSRLHKALQKASEGDFSDKLPENFSEKSLRETAEEYNRLSDLFARATETILQRFQRLIRDLEIQGEHPLQKATRALELLGNVYRYRFAMERDGSVMQLYEHLVELVRDVTGARHFSIYSIDRKEQIKTLIYSTASISNDPEELRKPLKDRTERIDLDEVVFEFPSMVDDEGGIPFYYCLPIDIDEYVTIIIALFAKEREELDRYRYAILELRYYLESVKPVIESKILTQKLREQSLLDGLTGLYNRKFLEEFIDKIDNQAKRSHTRYAIMMIDIDFFKHVNDNYGHDVGDKFIKLLGLIIQDHIRASDIAVRYGGEEFLVLLHESTREGALKVGETIRKDFSRRTIYANGERIRKTLSIGVSLFPEQAHSLREAIKFADIALYRAKESGRNQIVFFSDEMTEPVY